MELSGSNIKRIIIFSQRKAFIMFRKMEPSYISGNGTLHLPAQTHKKHKKKEKSPRKNPLYFRKWNFLALILKKLSCILSKEILS